MSEDTDRRTHSSSRLARTFSLAELLQKLVKDGGDLVRTEGDLIRSEMNDKVVQLQAGVGKIAAGGVVLLVALIVLADALVLAVADLLGTLKDGANDTGWASLIVASVFAAVGAVLVRSGTEDLKPQNLKPDRTALQVRRDTELAKDQMR
ncbi:MAG: phage holin family protein [Pseudomonadota bacterium]